MIKYPVNTELIDKYGEVVVVLDIDMDYHSRKKDYAIEVIYSVKHDIGSRFWMASSVVERWYRELNPQEKVLYGRNRD
jgi:hypothetical protein